MGLLLFTGFSKKKDSKISRLMYKCRLIPYKQWTKKYDIIVNTHYEKLQYKVCLKISVMQFTHTETRVSMH